MIPVQGRYHIGPSHCCHCTKIMLEKKNASEWHLILCWSCEYLCLGRIRKNKVNSDLYECRNSSGPPEGEHWLPEQGDPTPKWKISVLSLLQRWREQHPVLQSHTGVTKFFTGQDKALTYKWVVYLLWLLTFLFNYLGNNTSWTSNSMWKETSLPQWAINL